MRKLSATILTIIIISFGIRSAEAYGQSVTSIDDQLSQEDLKAVLDLLHVEVFKFNTSFPLEQKCTLVLYRQEYEKRKLIKDALIWGTPNPYHDFQDGKEIWRPVDQIRFIAKAENQEFSLAVKMGDFILNDYKIKIDTLYPNPHGCKPFRLPEKYNPGDKIPLLLIGSYWDTTSKDGKIKGQRFCWDLRDLSNDFSDKAFDFMPHYFVFGIKIEKSE